VARGPGFGPVEGWLARTRRSLGFVKGCHQPLPRLFYTPRLVGGRKTWNPPRGLVLDEAAAWTATRCGIDSYTLDPSQASLMAPWEAARRLRGCDAPLCRAALELLELLGLPLGEPPGGVTGGLAYSPRSAGDMDLVVYGLGTGSEVYRALHDLREEGVTAPLRGRGHGWSRADEALHEALARNRLLQGIYRGRVYEVRVVACTAPSPCPRIFTEGWRSVEGVVCGGLGYATPSLYRVCGVDGEDWLVVSYRLRYTELPRGLRVRVQGQVQRLCGLRVLVPDHGGSVEPLGLGP